MLALYCGCAVPQWGRGVAGLDGRGIIRVVNVLVNDGKIEISRPPGHPTTEFYLFGGIGWLLKHGFGQPFSDEVYLFLQFAAGAAALLVFYDLLLRFEITPWRAALAASSLAFSPIYLYNTLDGEEFIFEVLFILLAIRVLVPPRGPGSTPSRGRMLCSMALFAAATGCRPEAVFAGIFYPLYYYCHPKLRVVGYLAAAPVQVLLGLIIWLPVLLSVGVVRPYPSGMTLRESILGGGYKLAFLCFTLPVFILFAWTLVRSLPDVPRRSRAEFPKNSFFSLPWAWL